MWRFVVLLVLCASLISCASHPPDKIVNLDCPNTGNLPFHWQAWYTFNPPKSGLPPVGLLLNAPPSARSIQVVKSFYETNNFPSKFIEISYQGRLYFMVLIFPFSGPSHAYLHCYVKRGRDWFFHSSGFIFNTGYVKLQPNGDVVDVINDDKVVFKIEPLK
jgi:hypothetical protein